MSAEQPSAEKPDWGRSIYDAVYSLAERALANEPPGHSLQPTLLAHDAYLKLLEQRNIDPVDRVRFLAAGAVTIRRLLVDYARQRKAKKRGGDSGRGMTMGISQIGSRETVDVVELDDALTALAQKSERTAQVVQLKFFGGLTGEEIAEELQVSLRSVNNDWRFAKAWLYNVLRSADQPEKK